MATTVPTDFRLIRLEREENLLPWAKQLIDNLYIAFLQSGSAINTIGASGAGSVGATGAPGMDGIDGEDGWIGPSGVAGARGLQGLIGPPGLDGEDGVDSFIPGPQGLRGIQGLPGIPGIDGLDADDFAIHPAYGKPFDHHSDLTNQLQDDHTQYALLAGRAGGQTLYGGVTGSESITINSKNSTTRNGVMFESGTYNINNSDANSGILTMCSLDCTLGLNSDSVVGLSLFTGLAVGLVPGTSATRRTWTISANVNSGFAIGGATLFLFAPEMRNKIDADMSIMGFYTVFGNIAYFHSQGRASQNSTGCVYQGFNHLADFGGCMTDYGSAIAGTGTLISVGTAVTGTGTTFTTQLRVGDKITASSQSKTVTLITDNTHLTTNTAFSPVLASASFTFQRGGHLHFTEYVQVRTNYAGFNSILFNAAGGDILVDECGGMRLTYGADSTVGGNTTITDLYSVRDIPLLQQTAGTTAVTRRRGLWYQDRTGTINPATSVAVDVEAITAGTTLNAAIRSNIAAGTNNYFTQEIGGAKSEWVGKFTKYSNVAVVGFGVPGIVGYGRFTGQTAAKATVATFTPGADGTFCISANVNVTTATTHNFTVTCAYKDEGGTARTLTLGFTQLSGATFLTAITNLTGAGPYESPIYHIRAQSGTAITIATTGTFTTVTYNVEGTISQYST